MIEPVATASAPAALGPYSQGVKTPGYLFTSGQLGIVPATGELVSDQVADQVEQCIANLEAILAADGLTLADVVKTTVYLRSMGDFAAMNAVYARHFTAPFPARSAVEVGPLAKNALVEIEAVARRR
jgi:2-iminobutanoate/2-iminopropanoate deaminase